MTQPWEAPRALNPRMAPALESALRQGGADLAGQRLPAGHELSQDDLVQARKWLSVETT